MQPLPRPMYGSTTSSQHAPDRQGRDQAKSTRLDPLRGRSKRTPDSFLHSTCRKEGWKRPSSGLLNVMEGDPLASAGSGGGTFIRGSKRPSLQVFVLAVSPTVTVAQVLLGWLFLWMFGACTDSVLTAACAAIKLCGSPRLHRWNSMLVILEPVASPGLSKLVANCLDCHSHTHTQLLQANASSPHPSLCFQLVRLFPEPHPVPRGAAGSAPSSATNPSVSRSASFHGNSALLVRRGRRRPTRRVCRSRWRAMEMERIQQRRTRWMTMKPATTQRLYG